jgi:hypothetical protein
MEDGPISKDEPISKEEKEEIELQIKGLMQGANIPLKQVKDEICPKCPYKTPMCPFLMKIHEDAVNTGARFVCKGMRHWVTESN